jgi:manganese/zinc/iron transport system permease protein
MSITEYFNLLFTDYTLRTISLGTAVLGAICGMLGSFAVLRKQSLLGDAISHAALPGIAIAFLITGAKDTNILLLGALVSGLIGAFWIRGMISKTHLKSDTALGLVLSLFFGFGMLLLTYIQKQPNANQAGLDKYLFGQAATLVESDVLLMVLVTATAKLLVHCLAAAAGANNIALIKTTPTVCSPITIAKTIKKVIKISINFVLNPRVLA